MVAVVSLRCLFGFHHMVEYRRDIRQTGDDHEVTIVRCACTRCGYATIEFYHEYYGEYTGSDGVHHDEHETARIRQDMVNGYWPRKAAS